ncbi:MAG: hypothetical protein ABUS48_00430 [Pseudomonadota bacterium]
MARGPKMHRQPWTAAELKELRRLSKQKLGLVKIAKQLQRSTWSVRNRAYAEGISLSTR